MVKVTRLTKLEMVGVVSTTWLKHPFNEQTFHLKLGLLRQEYTFQYSALTLNLEHRL